MARVVRGSSCEWKVRLECLHQVDESDSCPCFLRFFHLKNILIFVIYMYQFGNFLDTQIHLLPIVPETNTSRIPFSKVKSASEIN